MFRVETYSIVCGNFGEQELSFELRREFKSEEDARHYFREFTDCLSPARYYVELVRYDDGKNTRIATFGAGPEDLNRE